MEGFCNCWPTFFASAISLRCLGRSSPKSLAEGFISSLHNLVYGGLTSGFISSLLVMFSFQFAWLKMAMLSITLSSTLRVSGVFLCCISETDCPAKFVNTDKLLINGSCVR